MENSWHERELPILRAIVEAEESGADVGAAARAAAPDLDGQLYMRCLDRLGDAGYLDVDVTKNGSDKYVTVVIHGALPPALREVGVWPRAATPLEEKRRRRLAFMERLYQRADGERGERASSTEIGAELGWSDDETFKIVRYLIDEGLIERPAMGPSVGLTHAGVREMEEALGNPHRATEHFPPISVIVVHGDVVGSQLQAGASRSSQERSQ
jgi:hypothetical protein